jgi:Nucleotidyl transferase
MAMRTGSPKVLAIVLAGGEGKRLMPLTADRAKPAVPFGGIYRLIDLALSNVVNSGYLKIVVLTQYKSHSLDRHISTTWRMSTMLGNYVTPVPAQQRIDKSWFQGSAEGTPVVGRLGITFGSAADGGDPDPSPGSNLVSRGPAPEQGRTDTDGSCVHDLR